MTEIEFNFHIVPLTAETAVADPGLVHEPGPGSKKQKHTNYKTLTTETSPFKTKTIYLVAKSGLEIKFSTVNRISVFQYAK